MKIIFLFVSLYVSVNLAYTNEKIDEHKQRTIEQNFTKVLKVNENTTDPIKELRNIVKNLSIEESNSRYFLDLGVCLACKYFIWNFRNNKIAFEILWRNICRMYMGLTTITIYDFCGQFVELNKPMLKYIVYNSNILDSELACSILLQNRNCYYRHPELSWRIDIAEPKSLQKHYGLRLQVRTKGDHTKPLKILHLTDIHISPQYEVGSVSNCGFPVCCLKGFGNPYMGEKAGKWGDYGDCDVPLHTFLDAMKHINSSHKDIDFIYFTGDIVDHRYWRATREEVTEIILYAYKVFSESFPGKLLLPTIGNHESVPHNLFAPPSIQDDELSQNWLYSLLSKIWKKWLPQDSLNTVKKQGYYSYLFNNKLRIIVLNNNICFYYNWWLLYNTTFLMEQLHWLRDELLYAEENSQFVHILAHVPPGNRECIEPWEVHYNALIKRFAHIISGQFYGHTHTDELKLFFEDNGRPINVGFNGASLTPYSKFNPNYKIMLVDPNTFEVLDIDTYIFNLTEANLNEYNSPKWYKLYSMKEAYDLKDLSPSSILLLSARFSLDHQLLNKYFRFVVRDGDASLQDGCDRKCKLDLITKLLTTVSISCTTSGCQ